MSIKPNIGDWYNSKVLGTTFEVIAYSEPDHSYEIQMFDGEISEIDEENWSDLSIEVSQPKDWSGALELPTEELVDYLGYYETGDLFEVDITGKIDDSFFE